MTDEYDSWRRYEDDKAFKNKHAELEADFEDGDWERLDNALQQEN